MREPHEFDKRILLVVTGKTPQIVTETLYKLTVDMTPSFIPDELHLITTQEGAKSARVALLGVGEQRGKFHQFCEDYSFNQITFAEQHIHIIEDNQSGQFLNDAESTLHNQMAADFITRVVRQLTQDDESALHVSLAGGRKTMSYYAGYALSLYGRMQDRLSHVLVNEPFQNNRKFFYPPPSPVCLEVGNEYFSTDDARIILSEIPYVRMRYQVPEQLLQGTAGFQETVEKIQRFSEPDTLTLKTDANIIICNDTPVKLGVSEFAFYLWLCERRKQGEPPLILEADDFMSDFLAAYRRFVNPNSGMYGRAEAVATEKGIEDQKRYFWSKRSTVHKKIKQALGEPMAKAFYIQLVEAGADGRVAYEVGLLGGQMTFD